MIKGKLVGLRALEKDDLMLLRDWRNLSSFRKNFREFRELNLVNQENWFAKLNSSPNDFMFMIERLDDKRPLGVGGLLYTNWVIRSADFSFYIGFEEAYVDKIGYASESVRLLIDYAFRTLNLNKVWMELYEFDQTKIELFTTEFGFKKDGLLRENCFEDGRYWNSWIISLLRHEYMNK
jgi:RimJ/RimL family protein N-acetyltransferase